MLVCNVVGARPNFMKMAPVVLELKRRRIPQFLVHTGQHYDAGLSQVFFRDLGIPQPDVHLGVGSDSHARQTARIMTAFEEICRERKPDLVIAGGDVNSTLAVALVASKSRIPLAHVEAGLRSFDRSMPEEVNRVVTDHLSDLLFTTEESANRNLMDEGIPEERVHFVGNCMVDTLLAHAGEAVRKAPWEAFGFMPRGYGLLTLHRPSNVDDPRVLRSLLEVLGEISSRLPILFPVHPRTRERMEREPMSLPSSLVLCEPLPYLAFLGLMAQARVVLTDSGGIQEETTALRVPCLTLRGNTERPVTLQCGTNRLVGTDPAGIRQGLEEILDGRRAGGKHPALWDGNAGQRIGWIVESWGMSKGVHCPVYRTEGAVPDADGRKTLLRGAWL
jgi:UDP-N-acetylglucosamine 2-epimerase (non-hydrolysing)